MGQEPKATLWAVAMPKPGAGQRWKYVGGQYFVDVTESYVPSDEAAVERAAKHLYLSPWGNSGFPVEWEDENEGHKDVWRERAVELLRAAGGGQ